VSPDLTVVHDLVQNPALDLRSSALHGCHFIVGCDSGVCVLAPVLEALVGV
jgi:hypothetical protein